MTKRCDIPARTLPPCDLPWGHDGDMHANGGDGFYAVEYDDEHRRRQRSRASGPSQSGPQTPLDALTALWSRQIDIKDLPEGDPNAMVGRKCEAIFTDGVDWLRSRVPNDRLRAIARVIWDLIGKKQVQVAVGPVDTLTFTVMRRGSVHHGLVIIPRDWPEQVDAAPITQLGAILFVGAQVVDFYNDRLIADQGAPARCHAYEAELLRTLRPLLPDWEPCAYQRDLLARYPSGLDSPGVETYAYRAYETPQGNA